MTMNINVTMNKKRIIQNVFHAILLLMSLIVIVFVLGIIIYIIAKGSSAWLPTKAATSTARKTT